MTRAQSGLTTLMLVLGCASYQYVEPEDAEPDDDGPGQLNGLGGSGGAAGKPATTKAGGGAGGKPMSTMAGRGGAAGSATMSDDGGDGSGGESEQGNNGGSSGGGGKAGSGGSGNQAPCDEATATVLGAMNANTTVLANVCLKLTIAADQTWIKKVTLQPEFGMYPLPFTWSNCTSTGSGAFTANYGNQVLEPVNLTCPILIKLGGSAVNVNVQWWGG